MNKESIKNKIRDDVTKEINYYIDEFDIEGEIKKFDIKGAVAQIIKDEIYKQVEKKIADAIFDNVQKTQPLIDAFTADTVKSIMIKFDKFINDHE